MSDASFKKVKILLRMDDAVGSTTAFDDRLNLASLVGGAAISAAPGGGRAAYFNGSGHYGTLAYLHQNLFGDLSQPWTFEYDAYVTGRYSTNQYPVIFSQEISSATRYTVFLLGNGTVIIPYFCCFKNNVQQYVPGPSFPPNAWTSIAVVCEGSGLLRIYRNGVCGSPITFTDTNQLSPAMNAYRLGQGINFPDNYVGYLKNIRFSNVARYSSTGYVPAAIESSDSVTYRMIDPSIPLYNAGYCGNGSVINTIALEDPIGSTERPLSRRVTLLDRRTYKPVAQTWADAASGAYRFENLRTDVDFMVVTDDYQGIYNAVIADWVRATA